MPLALVPRQVLSFGRCGKCGRDDQQLANGICPDCHFYDIKDVDPTLSERAQRGSGGVYDFVRGTK
jgi:hypothetical protein